MTALDATGFEVVKGVFGADEIALMLEWIPALDGVGGTRNLLDIPQCRQLAADCRVEALVAKAIGQDAVPIRAILFDKSPDANWNLGWHQDKKIAVKRRVDVDGFHAWSEKEGVVHCQPPSRVLESSVAVRIHLDPCGLDNGPLRAIPNSHLCGLRNAPSDAEMASQVYCTADVGDILLMKPLVFHASSKAESLHHRRVIHVEFSTAKLPYGLEWAYA